MITKSQITSLEGEYKMGNKIGEGTYAQVFKAESIRTGRVVAIKKVDKTKAKGMDIILNNEFDILREMVLNHPLRTIPTSSKSSTSMRTIAISTW